MRLASSPLTARAAAMAVSPKRESSTPAARMEALAEDGLERLRRARTVIQSELERQGASPSPSPKHLLRLRMVSETCAKQADDLIRSMAVHRVDRKKRARAEELRLFFRLAIGCATALLDSARRDPENPRTAST